MAEPSLAIKLFGTEEPVVPMRTLRAGPLTAEFDQGALRFIKIGGKEAIRNIAFVVRDKDWGTYNPAISNLEVSQSDQGFTVSFDAICKDDTQEFHYSANITGDQNGTLTFSGTGKAITDFVTNRTGFVVLHPVVGISGFPVEIEQVDGRSVVSEFPELVDPIQPFKDIRALTHAVAPGIKVTCKMEGETFEMEDHRQWNDASYKTYVRPIGLPWPFTIGAGDTTEQSVTLTINGDVSVASQGADNQTVITVGNQVVGTMPKIGLGLEPQHTKAALERSATVKSIAPQWLVCWHDLRANHGTEELRAAKALGASLNAELILEAVLPCEDYEKEMAAIAAQARGAEITFEAVSFSPAEYLKSIMPGTRWPDVPPLADLYDCARRAFPGVTLGGGMHAFFPELNRHRPPTDHLDYVSHTSNTITHACDDITVTENLEALPFVIKTCRSFAAGKPYRVGPSAIGMRFNPYGSRTMDNPNNQRIAMARMEPRQRGLVNAAWTIGYVAHMARGDVDAVTLQAPVGEFGLVYHPMEWEQPWFDDANAEVYPAYHCVAGLAAAAGAKRLLATSSNSHDVECVAFRQNGKTILWIANLSGREQRITVNGLPVDQSSVKTLDAETFEQCVRSVGGFDETASPQSSAQLSLSAYAVVCLSSEAESG